MTVLALVLVDCKGECGVLVRPDAEKQLCDKCLDLDRLLEARRCRDARNRIYGVGQPVAMLTGDAAENRWPVGVGEFARTDVGVVPHAPGDPCRLDEGPLTLREKAACVVMSLGIILVAALACYAVLWALGGR